FKSECSAEDDVKKAKGVQTKKKGWSPRLGVELVVAMSVRQNIASPTPWKSCLGHLVPSPDKSIPSQQTLEDLHLASATTRMPQLRAHTSGSVCPEKTEPSKRYMYNGTIVRLLISKCTK
ncbi:hypothetical protein AKJ16_DCAP01456, partial [Drosera capensis]